MNVNKIRSTCRIIRIIVGSALVITGVVQLGAMEHAEWFFLGAIPLIAGIVNFCPLCLITKQCDLPKK